MSRNNGHVAYYLNGTGYEVVVYQGDEVVERYEAGNSPLDSAAVVPDDEALTDDTLKGFAESMAREMAVEHGISASRVYYDSDAENEARAMKARD